MSFSSSFFEVSAQLIPVLFLAMVVEDRLQPEEEESPGERVMRSWVIALLVVGEVLALAVIAGGLDASQGTGTLVASSMLFAAFLIVLPVMSRELRTDRSHRERLGHAAAALLVIAAVVGTSLAMQLA
jgi:hypothetical protein